MRKLGLLVFLLAALTLARGQVEQLTPANFARLRDQVNVKPAELGWQRVPWHDSFFAGLVEAQAKDKPIFYWLYFGDPRGGC